MASEGALTIGTIDEIQKLHIRTVPLGETPRYSTASLNLQLLRCDRQFSPLAAKHSHVNKLQEFGVRSDNNSFLICLSVLITCLLDDVWIF